MMINSFTCQKIGDGHLNIKMAVFVLNREQVVILTDSNHVII